MDQAPFQSQISYSNGPAPPLAFAVQVTGVPADDEPSGSAVSVTKVAGVIAATIVIAMGLPVTVFGSDTEPVDAVTLDVPAAVTGDAVPEELELK